jgi:tetratricopeptide (TPR) repeat protein
MAISLALLAGGAWGAEEVPVRPAPEAGAAGAEGGGRGGRDAARGAQRVQGDRGQGGRAVGARGGGGQELQSVNAVDAVSLTLAVVYVEKGRIADALKLLEGLAAGDDADTAGFARLEMARIYRQQDDREKAAAELAKVRGPAAVLAAGMMLEGGGEPTPEKIEELLKAAEDPLAKAVLLRRLAGAYQRTGDTEKLVDLVARAEKLVSRGDAVKALEIERLVRAASADNFARGMQGMFDRAQGMANQFQERRTAMEKEAQELEAQGKKDEAARVREQLERMNRMDNFMRGARGDRRPGGEEGARPGGGREPAPIPGGGNAEQF